MYSEQTLAEIRERMNIVELVGEYVQLKKSGQGFLGLCPFHNEKSPSFHVHPLRQCFHCFGCQKGGNVFTFLSAVEGLKFPEAVQRLAKRTGVTLEQTFVRREARQPDRGTLRLFEAQEWATKYFQYLLWEVPDYRPALEYVRSRGLGDATIKKFRIGVAPKGWNTLLTLMLKRDFLFEELTAAGLIIPKENSPTQGYDRFRHRLMFPITNAEGNVLAFGARQLEEDEKQPKYINSPESPLFSKRKILYGLYENQRGIRLRGEAVVVEGYMDVVGLAEGGVNNAIATMGTAMTEEHCQQLKALTRRVVTVFDPDAAGSDAWHRSIHLFLHAGIFAKDLSLPEGKDPDEFIAAEGAETFYQLCEKAPRQVTKMLKEIAARGPLSEEESSRILGELTPILIATRRLPDRAMLWDDISLVLKVSVSAIKEIAESAALNTPRKAGNEDARSGNSSRQGPKAPVPWPPAKPTRTDAVDLEFFQASLRSPEEFLKLPRDIWQGALREKRIAAWLERMAEAKDSNEFEVLLTELFAQETDGQFLALASAELVRGTLSPEATSAAAKPKEKADAFQAIAERLRKRKKEMEIKALSAQVKLTQRLGDDAEQMRLLTRLKDLRSS